MFGQFATDGEVDQFAFQHSEIIGILRLQFVDSVENGKILFNLFDDPLLLRGGTAGSVCPRTAFGLTADGKTLILLVVDGRQPGYSMGASIDDLRRILRSEGCSDAVDMDGGGSSSLVVFDRKSGTPRMLNRHKDGLVRKVGLNFGITF